LLNCGACARAGVGNWRKGGPDNDLISFMFFAFSLIDPQLYLRRLMRGRKMKEPRPGGSGVVGALSKVRYAEPVARLDGRRTWLRKREDERSAKPPICADASHECIRGRNWSGCTG